MAKMWISPMWPCWRSQSVHIAPKEVTAAVTLELCVFVCPHHIGGQVLAWSQVTLKLCPHHIVTITRSLVGSWRWSAVVLPWRQFCCSRMSRVLRWSPWADLQMQNTSLVPRNSSGRMQEEKFRVSALTPTRAFQVDAPCGGHEEQK